MFLQSFSTRYLISTWKCVCVCARTSPLLSLSKARFWISWWVYNFNNCRLVGMSQQLGIDNQEFHYGRLNPWRYSLCIHLYFLWGINSLGMLVYHLFMVLLSSRWRSLISSLSVQFHYFIVSFVIPSLNYMVFKAKMGIDSYESSDFVY